MTGASSTITDTKVRNAIAASAAMLRLNGLRSGLPVGHLEGRGWRVGIG